MKRLIIIGTFIGMALLFNSGCEMIPPTMDDKFISVEEGVQYQDTSITGVITHVFPFSSAIRLKFGEDTVEVVLKDHYTPQEINNWLRKTKTFIGRLEGDLLTNAELEN